MHPSHACPMGRHAPPVHLGVLVKLLVSWTPQPFGTSEGNRVRNAARRIGWGHMTIYGYDAWSCDHIQVYHILEMRLVWRVGQQHTTTGQDYRECWTGIGRLRCRFFYAGQQHSAIRRHRIPSARQTRVPQEGQPRKIETWSPQQGLGAPWEG